MLLILVFRTGMSQVATARLEGVIQDASGAAVPGAKVSVVNERTQVRMDMSGSPEGLFVFPSLPPSVYTLSVEAAGFRKAVVSKLELAVSESVSQIVRMEVGAVTESVAVAANEARVQTADAQIARATTLRDIDVLPQLSRSPMSLTIFSPGVQYVAGSGGLSGTVNGTRKGSSNIKLDGIDVNDSQTPFLALSTTPNNSDSVEEFRIVTSGGKAEYGRSAGGQVELITRSGSNVWHGNAFEYLRNTVLNANNFFNNLSGLDRPALVQNRFGGSLGGPIRRERTFIFGNFLGQRTSQQIVRNRLVLTPPAKAGLFRWKSPGSAETQAFDILRNDPRGKGIDPQVAAILKLLPDPNNYDTGDGLNTAGYRFNNPASASTSDGSDDAVTIKVDHNLWNGHRVFFRWAWDHPLIIDNLNNVDAAFPGQPQGTQGGRRWGYSIGSDWAITARLVNELRVGYKYYFWDFARLARLHEPMLLANSWYNPLNPAFGTRREPTVRHIADNFTVVHGKHTFKAGLDWRFTRQWASNDAGIWANVSFGTNLGNAPTGIGPSGALISTANRATFENLYNDLLGRMNQVTETFYSDLGMFQPAGTPRVRDHRFHEYGYFFQDDWKLHPRLVLNLGLRYEFNGVPFEANGIQGTVDKAALVNAGARISDLTVQRSSRWYDNDFNNFAPRVGLAWDLTGGGKTVLRASWGIFFDRLIGATTNQVDVNTPGFAQNVPVYPNQAGADVRVSDGIPLPQPPAAPVLRPPADRTNSIFLFTPDLRTGYVQHYSLTLQREIVRNTVVEAGYVGTHGIKLFMDLNLNQPRVYEDFLGAFRELQLLRANAPASNTLVRIFGTAAAAINSIGSNTLDQGALGSAADSLDLRSYSRYKSAGVFDFYLRNFPQFNQVIIGANDGRSYYDSFQFSFRRQAGALRFVANYTFSKSMDNISAEGQGFTSPIDNFNVRINRARSDFDIPHAFNASFIYTLPIGKGRRFGGNAPRWVDSVAGGWDLGLLTMWQSGRALTYLSGRATGPTTNSGYPNYSGDRNAGRVIRKGDGVYWLTPGEIGSFSFAAAGEIGTSGRNAFRGPRYFDVDLSLVKKFKITEQYAISFRAEAYNLFNNVNFDAPNANLSTLATFGKISGTVGNARTLQMALRFEF
ncbi:MAG: TonB-dependent receptor [Acidobacteriia bacterium]|nr:TonB-dependent receptor [Terriglobia bacterium]